jgi:hypothetical protein
MTQPLNAREGAVPPAPLLASERPNRLSLAAHITTLVLLGLSFISGVLIWRGVHLQHAQLETPTWLRASVVLHGALNPFLCVLFGYFLCDHIRLGWRLRANRITGFAMEACFAALILTGIGLYYSGGETLRPFWVIAHRALGVALPVCLAAHWIAAKRWEYTLQTPPQSRSSDIPSP